MWSSTTFFLARTCQLRKHFFVSLFSWMIAGADFCEANSEKPVSDNYAYEVWENTPIIDLENNYLICDKQPLMLDAGNVEEGVVYKWENLTTNKVVATTRRFEVSDPGHYRLTVAIDTETATKDFVVTESFTPQITIQAKTYSLCVGSVITFDAGNAGANFVWLNDNSGDTISKSQTATIAFKGKYTVAAITPCGTSVGSFIVDEITYPDLKEVPAVGYLCTGDSVTIDAKNFDSRAVWIEMETGDTIATTKRITLGKTGDYKLTLYNQCDTVSKVVEIAPREFPVIDLDDEMFICGEDPIELDAGNVGASYEWVNVDTKAVISNAQSIIVDNNGLFSVKVIDPCGVVFDTVKVSKAESPKISLRSQYLICDGVADEITMNLFNVDFEWSRNGEVVSTDPVFKPSQVGDYTITVSNKCGIASHHFSVVESFVPEISIPSQLNLLAFDGAVILDAGNEGATYKWLDIGSGTIIAETRTVEITQSGDYLLGVNTVCGGKEKAFSVNLITGISEEGSASYLVTPNPALSNIFIQNREGKYERLSVTLSDISGKNVYSTKLFGIKENEPYSIDVSGFPKGIYILNISGERTYRTKIILQ